jgi:hypothetical protein
MKSGVLLVSRYANLLPFYKSFFEGLGFPDVHTTDKDKDGLNMLINELNPRRIFIRVEGFNTPPFRAVKKVLNPEYKYLIRTTYLVLQGEVC